MGNYKLLYYTLWFYTSPVEEVRDSISYYSDRIKETIMKYKTSERILINALSGCANFYILIGQTDKAIVEAQALLEVAKRINSQKGFLQVNQLMGAAFYKQQLWQLSLKYDTQALEILKKINDLHTLDYHTLLAGIITAHLAMNHLKEAEERMKELDELGFEGNRSLVIKELQLKGKILLQKHSDKEFNVLIAQYKKTLEDYGYLPIPSNGGMEIAHGIYGYYSLLAEYYLKHNEYEKALENSQYILDINPQSVRPIMAEALYGIEKYTEAATMYKALYQETDSLQKYNTNSMVAQFAALTESETLKLKYAEAQIEAQKAELARNRIATSALVLVIVIGIAFFYRNSKLMKKLRISQINLQEKNEKLVLKENEILAALNLAEEANRVKTSFLQNVTHEIRTPLNGVAGFVQLLSVYTEQDKVMVEEIQRNTNSLVKLVDTIIELSDYDTAGKELEYSKTDLTMCCVVAVEQASLNLQSGVVLDMNLPEETFPIYINEEILIKLIACLVHNAVKFTMQGKIKVGYQADEDKITIYVEDTGKGIPDDKIDWIFQRFTKVDEFVPGFGLGLPLAQAMAQRLHGELKLDTTYATGARFIIILPRELK